jgi:NADPH2:quinone reductase
MRAIVCTAFDEPLATVERDDPMPGPGQVLVEVTAVGVNYVDALIVTGRYQIKPPTPFSPGSEVSGQIVACGEGVDQFTPGDRVLALPGFGGYVDRLVIDQAKVSRIPDALGDLQAAGFVQSYCTALFALRNRGRLQPGEQLLVLGAAGGVGRAAIDVGKALGARVIAAASSAERLAACTALGADASIDYSHEDLKEKARELSGGGVDLVFDPVGDHLAEPALRAMGYDGRYLVIGFAGGEIPRLPINQVLLRNRNILGVDWGAWSSAFQDAQNELLSELLEMAGSGGLHPSEPHPYPFDAASEALDDLIHRRVHGKIVLLPSTQ